MKAWKWVSGRLRKFSSKPRRCFSLIHKSREGFLIFRHHFELILMTESQKFYRLWSTLVMLYTILTAGRKTWWMFRVLLSCTFISLSLISKPHNSFSIVSRWNERWWLCSFHLITLSLVLFAVVYCRGLKFSFHSLTHKTSSTKVLCVFCCRIRR